MFMMVIAHAHEGCFQLQEELDFRLYEAVLLFAGTQQMATKIDFFTSSSSTVFLSLYTTVAIGGDGLQGYNRTVRWW